MYLRQYFILVIMGLLSVTTASAQENIDQSPSIVLTQNGLVEGKTIDNDISAFLGIPYAKPPVRELRWREPQPTLNWEGTFHADRFAPQCTQPLRSNLNNQYPGAAVTSEDCLYLNVWTKPGLNKAPVIVYIHGGAFFIGSGSMPIYDGAALADHGAVFVNFNYRLGILGFLSHPELTLESAHGYSGNYGFLDQIAALQWVRNNIEKFGGDPDNVTIVGQSAGSMSVLALQASPLAKGLFHRAVGMSGANLENTGPFKIRELDEAENEGIKVQQILKADSLDALRALAADRLVVARGPNSPRIGPIIDGYVLPSSVEDIFNNSAQSDVPLLLGFTRDEALGGMGAVTGLEDYKQRVATKYGSRATEFFNLYPAINDEEAIAQARAADRDSTVASAMYAWAKAQVKHGRSPVYSYMFSREHVYPDGVTISGFSPATAGAYHTSEVPFWLGTLESFNLFRKTRSWRQADFDFSEEMMKSLVAFAHTGSPITDQWNWEAFNLSQPRLLEMGSSVELSPWPDKRKFEFFGNHDPH